MTGGKCLGVLRVELEAEALLSMLSCGREDRGLNYINRMPPTRLAPLQRSGGAKVPWKLAS